MKNILKDKTLFIISYLYLYIPIFLFFANWVKPIIAIPVILVSMYCLFSCFKNSPKIQESIFRNKKIVVIISILVIWVILSGIGGLAWQNRYDHAFRNAIFKDLILYKWPVINTDGPATLNLCYYFGYWLPSALVAKLFNSISVGYLFQFIWGSLGVILTFFLISQWLKKISYKTLIIFIFFSGLDIIALLYLKHPELSKLFIMLRNARHIELELYLFNSSSNTTLLFWVYNQAIPFWIGFMLILLQKNKKHIFFTYSLLILYAPFPAFGLIPAILYLELRNRINKDSLKEYMKELIKNTLTIENLTGISILIVVGLFYRSNISANIIQTVPLSSYNRALFMIYFLLEYGIFILFIYKKVKNDCLFHILILTMIVCSFFRLGSSYDFAWRTCIPASFYLMLLIMKEFTTSFNFKKITSNLLIAVLILGSITPGLEILRTVKVYYNVIVKKEDIRFLNDNLESTFINNTAYNNFIGKEDSFFNKYIRKQPKK